MEKEFEFTGFERTSISGFARREFTTKEDLNTWRQVLLLDLRLWLH